MEEIWKDIPGREGSYQISNIGRVRSLDRYIYVYRIDYKKYVKRFMPGAIKKQCIYATKQNKRWGYYYTVALANSNRTPVHRLVAQAFIPNPDNLREVNHKDGNKINNHIDNLEWINRRSNVTHAYKSTKKTSKYVGVCWLKRDKKWEAYINIKYKKISLGYHEKEEDARDAYIAALAKYGLKNKYATFE